MPANTPQGIRARLDQAAKPNPPPVGFKQMQNISWSGTEGAKKEPLKRIDRAMCITHPPTKMMPEPLRAWRRGLRGPRSPAAVPPVRRLPVAVGRAMANPGATPCNGPSLLHAPAAGLVRALPRPVVSVRGACLRRYAWEALRRPWRAVRHQDDHSCGRRSERFLPRVRRWRRVRVFGWRSCCL